MTATRNKRDYGFAAVLLLLIAGIVALIRVPDQFSDPVRESAAYQENRRRIEDMTESQRDRIETRAKRFNKLSKAQKDEKRDLHKALQNAPDSRRLKAVLGKFNAWMASLPLVERLRVREELRNAKSPEERSRIITAEKDRQEDLRLVSSLPGPQRRAIERETNPERKKELISRFRESMSFRYRRSRSGRDVRLDEEQLDAVIAVIAGKLSLTPQQKSELKSLRPSGRRLRTLVFAMKEHGQRRDDTLRLTSVLRFVAPAAGLAAGSRPGLLADNDLRKAIEAEIQDADLKKKLLEDPWSRFRRNRYHVLFLVSRALFEERRTIAGDPTDEQLSKFFQKLDRTKQDEIMRAGGSNQKQLLKREYYNRGGADGEDFQAFMSEWFNTMRRFSWRRPRPGGPDPAPRGGPRKRGPGGEPAKRGNGRGRRGSGGKRGNGGGRNGRERPTAEGF